MDQALGARTGGAGKREGVRRLPLLASVAVVCRSIPSIGGLDEAKHAIDAFADVSPLWTAQRAFARNPPGLLRLLRRVAAREDPEMEPLYRRWRFEQMIASAIQLNTTPVVHWLVEEYAPDCKIWIGAEKAALCGRLDLLQWLKAKHSGRVVWMPSYLLLAARAGSLETVQWLHANAAPASLTDEKEILGVAAKNGDVAMAEWICQLHVSSAEAKDDAAHQMAERARELAQARRMLPRRRLLGKPLTYIAVANGHVEMTKWLLAQGVTNAIFSSALGRAAVGGHFAMIEWAAHTFPVKSKRAVARALIVASECGRLDVVQTLCKECGGVWTAAMMDSAAANGHLDMIKWLHENRPEGCSVEAMDGAASNGHLSVVQWLHQSRSEGCTVRAMDDAAANGHLDVVKWLHEHRTEGCTTVAMDRAAAATHLDIVRWLHEHQSEGCTTDAMDDAAGKAYHVLAVAAHGMHRRQLVEVVEENRRLAVIQFLHENRGEGCTTKAMNQAAGHGFLKIVQWLHANRSEGCTTDAMDNAARNGHFDVVKWLNENRSEGCGVEALNHAAYAGHLQVVQYLYSSVRGEAITERTISMAASAGHAQVLKWLLSRYDVVRIESDVMCEPVKRGDLETLMVLRNDRRCGVELDEWIEAISKRCFAMFHRFWGMASFCSLKLCDDLLESLSRENTIPPARACLREFVALAGVIADRWNASRACQFVELQSAARAFPSRYVAAVDRALHRFRRRRTAADRVAPHVSSVGLQSSDRSVHPRPASIGWVHCTAANISGRKKTFSRRSRLYWDSVYRTALSARKCLLAKESLGG